MQYHRYGHMKDVFVKLGDKVKKGQKIATVGTGNGQWSAHLHYDCPIKKLTSWTGYVFGWTLDEVKEIYADPKPFIKNVFPEYDHLGYDYLEHANYGTAAATKWCFHPGKDLNGAGAGNADLGDPIYAACDGEVVYCYNGTGTNGGWGKLIVIEEKEEEEVVASGTGSTGTEKTKEVEKEDPVANVNEIPQEVNIETDNINEPEKKNDEPEQTETIQSDPENQDIPQVEQSPAVEEIEKVSIDWKKIWEYIINLFFRKK